MSTELFIELENPTRSYFAGQLVQGRVVVKNDGSLKVKEVTVLLQGKGHLDWTETEGYNNNGFVQTYISDNFYASESYVDQKLSLAGDTQNVMEPVNGIISYPFEFILPNTCPSSFTSQSGSVSYLVEAELKCTLQEKIKRATLPITVSAIVDLNLEVDAIRPQQQEKVKNGNVFLLRSGDTRLALKLPKRSGFVPGQVLDFEAQVTNSSNVDISWMSATLFQVKTFHAKRKTKRVERMFCQVRGPKVEAGDKKVWVPQNLVIPPLPPTNLGGSCRIIGVQYYITVSVHFTGLSSPFSVQLPVFIGTIPLREEEGSELEGNAISVSTEKM